MQSIGQVIASAKLMNDDVVSLATVFKLMRVLLLVGVALVYGRMNTGDGVPLFSRSALAKPSEKAKLSVGVPWFIFGFLILFLIRSIETVPEPALAASKAISAQFEVAALAVISMRVKFADIVKEGPKAMLYSLTVGAVQVVMAVGLI